MIKLCRDPTWAPGSFILARKRADGSFDYRDEVNSVLIQLDWDFPSVAETFGWSLRSVQKLDNGEHKPCDHSSTDGTVDCPDCNLKSLDFIVAAGQYLYDNVGAVAKDPGYF